MERILTTTPINIIDLKRKFNEDIKFIIDYKNSKYKGKTFIIYLSNLDIDCEIQLEDKDDALGLVSEYLKASVTVSIPEVEDALINILLAYQGKPNYVNFDITDFVTENKEIIDIWIARINSLYLYSLFCTNNDSNIEYMKTFPENKNNSLAGINFVQLIKHELFPLLIQGVDHSKVEWNEFWFKEYVFAGQCLYNFFSSENNPLFLGVLASVTDPDLAELKSHYAAISNAEELKNVSLIQ